MRLAKRLAKRLLNVFLSRSACHSPKHDYVPNPIWDIPNRIWNTVGFGTLGVPNLTMFQINIGTFGSWLGFSYVIPNPTMYQTYLR